MYTGLRSVNFIVSNLFAGDGSGVENYSNLFYTHLATYLPLILLWQPISKSYSRRHPYYPWFSFLIMLCSNDIKETTIQLLENILYIFHFLFRDHQFSIDQVGGTLTFLFFLFQIFMSSSPTQSRVLPLCIPLSNIKFETS